MKLLIDAHRNMNIIHTNNSNKNNNNNNNNRTMDNNNRSSVPRKARTKLKAINNFLTCCLCKGYIIEATAISDCLHSFCRSCIVKHLKEHAYCPKCSLKGITISSLRPDDIIKSLVYKVVPALYQSECQRIEKFNKTHNVTISNGEGQHDDKFDQNRVQQQHYFSPDEPISLSLTYHAESLAGSGITTPPINYLQCPAAVTVHHLKRFVSAKYGINIERDVNIEIICEDEVLPEDFTLMDVAYCFNWTRTSPMQLMFRILLKSHDNNNKMEKSKHISLPIAGDDENNKHHPNINRRVDKRMDNNQYDSNNRYSKNQSYDSAGSAGGRTCVSQKNTNTKAQDAALNDFKRLRSNAGASPASISIIRPMPSAIRNESGTKKNLLKNVTFASGSSVINPNAVSKNELNSKKGINSNSKTGTVMHDGVQKADYKSASIKTEEKKQNKVENNELSNTSNNNNSKQHVKKCEEISVKRKDDGKNNKITVKNQNDDDESSFKLRYEAESSKKCYSNTKKVLTANIVGDERQQLEKEEMFEKISKTEKIGKSSKGDKMKVEAIPKLKIDLPSMKPKILLPTEEQKPKIILKLPSPIEKKHITVTEPKLNLTEYAKTIGLQPVSELQKRQDNNIVSTSSKKDTEHNEVSHKKRKKAKHSKEPNGKKRKLHAEISSLTVNDEVKLKVKISSKPPHKHDKRSNSTDDIKHVDKNIVTSSSSSSTQISSTISSASSITSNESKTATSSILRTVRHKPMVSIPNVNKSLSDEQDMISDILKRVQQTPSVKAISPQDLSPKSPTPPKLDNLPTQPKLSQITSLQQPKSSNIPSKQQSSISKASSPILESKQDKVQPSLIMMPPFSQASSFDLRMQRMSSPSQPSRVFSPRPSPVNTITMPPPRNQMLSTGLNKNVPQVGQKRTMSNPLCTSSPKAGRLDLMEINEQNKLMRKNVYTLLPSLELANLNNNKKDLLQAQQQPPNLINRPQNPINRSLPTKNPTLKTMGMNIKKPMPRLIAPSSISVTRVGDTSNSPITSQINRPAVEILKIPSTVPVIDQKLNKPLKTNKPLPGTIPLNKIQNRSFQLNKSSNFLKMGLSTNLPQKSESDKALDLSPSATNNAEQKKLESQIIDLTGNTDKTSDEQRSKVPTSVSSNVTNMNGNNKGQSLNNSEKPKMPGLTALPLPKLNEIPKNRAPVRQPNLSVRNVPNPSALAYRNQTAPANTGLLKAPTITNTTTTLLKGTPPLSKLNEKVQQLHNLKESQQRSKITPED